MDEARERFDGSRRAAPAPCVAHRLSVSARCRRSRRGRPGRLRQGLHSHHARIARPGRSRSGSREFSSTAASIDARRECRRDRWFVPAPKSRARTRPASSAAAAGTDPEHRLLARERRARMAAAIDRLDGRQRTVFMLCHYGDCTPREVSAMTGLNESTVRVHLFRAARKLRGLLGGQAVIASRASPPRTSACSTAYLAERGRRTPDPRRSPSISPTARPCARPLRGAGAAFMDALRQEGEAEADAVFTPERLRQQQQQIARRLEHVGRAARVISFPGRIVQRHDDRVCCRRRRRAGLRPRPPPACSSASRSARQFAWRRGARRAQRFAVRRRAGG